MINKVSQKKNISSMQVLKTLQVLLQGNFTMHEIIKRLNNNEKEPIFNNSVVSKYINTCRYCGVEIPKIHNIYFVTKMPFGIDLTTSETDLIENLIHTVQKYMSNKHFKIFNTFVEKINRYSNKKITRVDKDSYNLSFELFENAVADKRKVKLLFKNRVVLEGIPLKIIENNGKTFFHVYCKNKERTIDADRISGIEILKDKFIQNFTDQSVVFVLKGDLAKRYTLRENETLIKDSAPNTITVSNRGENKAVLFARLLRYDDKCEIMTPKAYREEMHKLISDALENYGV